MIGLFDSGYGGLSVYAALAATFPRHDMVYLGDNARAPYGGRSPEIITEYTKEALIWLFAQGVSVAVVACNTASAQALPALQGWLASEFPEKKVIGVIEPTVAYIESLHLTEPVGVIGTKSTIRSGMYARLLKGIVPEVIERETPLLASLVEEGKTDGPTAEHILADYLVPLIKEGVSHIILGCTHYFFLRETIKARYPHVRMYDASDALPVYLADILAEPGRELAQGSMHRFATTDKEDDFAHFVEEHLGLSIEVERIKLASVQQ